MRLEDILEEYHKKYRNRETDKQKALRELQKIFQFRNMLQGSEHRDRIRELEDAFKTEKEDYWTPLRENIEGDIASGNEASRWGYTPETGSYSDYWTPNLRQQRQENLQNYEETLGLYQQLANREAQNTNVFGMANQLATGNLSRGFQPQYAGQGLQMFMSQYPRQFMPSGALYNWGQQALGRQAKLPTHDKFMNKIWKNQSKGAY